LSELIPQTLKGIGEAFNAHDAQKMSSYFADDVSDLDYGIGEIHNKAGITGRVQRFLAAFPDVKIRATRVWIKGNVAISELTWVGTMTGDMMGMKATNKQAGGTRVHVSFFNDDGLVKEQHEYADEAGMMGQINGKKGAPPVPTLATNPPEIHLGKGSPEEDKLVDWAKASDETFSKGDAKAVLAAASDDADYWVNFSGHPAMKGKKEMSAGLTAWFKTFPDQKWTPANAWGIDGYAIVEHTVTGTQKGPLGTFPASNKKVTDWHWLDISQPSADGKLLHGWGYANLVEALSQVGALKGRE
jgi:ketosteroid isomerase-like protein